MTTFWKYEGAGNDFVIIDNRPGTVELSKDQIAAVCRRRFGVGADGLMMLETDSQGGSEGTDFYMRYFNADGGESTMCGNGGRCIALFAEHLGIGGRIKHFNSSDGFHDAELLDDGRIRLKMMDVREIGPTLSGAFFANTGSPHYVEFVEDVGAIDVNDWGRKIRHGEEFARTGGVNVNFVQVLAPGRLRVRTYERGVEAETLACGTGVTASVLVADMDQVSDIRDYTVEVEGGRLEVEFERDGEGTGYRNIYLTGPAKRVFEGEIEV